MLLVRICMLLVCIRMYSFVLVCNRVLLVHVCYSWYPCVVQVIILVNS